jgi:hypothetical protein
MAIMSVFYMREQSNRATAAPPTIRPKPHAFDPDWLELQSILGNKCIGCHRPGTDQYDLSSYEALMAAGRKDGYPAIVPGRVQDSHLWMYVNWNVRANAGSQAPDEPLMPPEREEWLTAGQLETIKRWINNGALEYDLPQHCNIRPLLETDFPSARQCAACHPKQYEQWSRSMHAYAMQSPIFEAFNLTLHERTSGTIGTFCSRCHSNIGAALGESGSLRNVHRSQISLEGVTCITCHRRPAGHYKSSGRVAVEPGQLLDTCVFGPFQSSLSLQVNSHPSAEQPYLKSSQFCGECHDVTSPNGIRLEEAFSEWQNSPAAKKGITCQQCHMGPVQGIPIPDSHRPLGRAAQVPGVPPEHLPLRHLTDHTFAGPDYSLLPDTEFPHKLDWMYETDYRDTNRLTPYQQRTLVELRRANRESLRAADAKRYELLRNAAKINVSHLKSARPNEKVKVHVDVVNKVAGHSFPTGFTAERQLWVSVEVRDPTGRLIFSTGDFDRHGDLRDEHSHDVLTGYFPHDRFLLNFQNKFTVLTNKGTERTVVLSVNRDLSPLNVLRPAPGISASFGRPASFRIAKYSLPPLRSIGKSFPVHLANIPGPHRIRVRLNFRHLPPALFDHIGTPHLKHLLETVVIDQYHGVINVTP